MSEGRVRDTSLWRLIIIPALVTAVISTIVLSLVNGTSGALGASLASMIVIIFFGIHILVARVSLNLDPMATMALALLSYFFKVISMGIFLFLVTKFTDRSTVDRVSFAICAILIIIVWLSGEIRSFHKLRWQLPLPNKKGDTE
jgi:ATP synthase protein I